MDTSGYKFKVIVLSYRQPARCSTVSTGCALLQSGRMRYAHVIARMPVCFWNLTWNPPHPPARRGRGWGRPTLVLNVFVALSYELSDARKKKSPLINLLSNHPGSIRFQEARWESRGQQSTKVGWSWAISSSKWSWGPNASIAHLNLVWRCLVFM